MTLLELYKPFQHFLEFPSLSKNFWTEQQNFRSTFVKLQRESYTSYKVKLSMVTRPIRRLINIITFFWNIQSCQNYLEVKKKLQCRSLTFNMLLKFYFSQDFSTSFILSSHRHSTTLNKRRRWYLLKKNRKMTVRLHYGSLRKCSCTYLKSLSYSSLTLPLLFDLIQTFYYEAMLVEPWEEFLGWFSESWENPVDIPEEISKWLSGRTPIIPVEVKERMPGGFMERFQGWITNRNPEEINEEISTRILA